MTSLIIPCYNESARFHLLREAVLCFDASWSLPFEAILVNDGSTDNTLTLMNELATMDLTMGQVIVLDLPNNVNKGGALKEGIHQAKGDFILTLDADMSTPPSQLIEWQTRLNTPFKDDTIYIGSRGHELSQLDALANRKSLGGIFNSFIKWVTPLNHLDTQCGFKLYPKAIAKDLFAKLEDLGWAHDVEILTRAHYQSIQIIDMPISWTHVDGSKISVLKDGIIMAYQSYKIGRRLKKEYQK